MSNRNQSSQAKTSPIIHENIFMAVKSKMPKDEILYDLADFFKIFGDSTRIKILYALLSSEMCVQDLAELLDMNQSAISHQLRILKQAHVVKHRKEGKFVFYSLDDEHVNQIVAQGMAHLSEKS
jgi:DNA-binding transcriptional ArsR family regulator